MFTISDPHDHILCSVIGRSSQCYLFYFHLEIHRSAPSVSHVTLSMWKNEQQITLKEINSLAAKYAFSRVMFFFMGGGS